VKFGNHCPSHGDADQIVPIGASAMLSSKLVKGSTLLTFHPAPPPSDEDVAQVLATVRARVEQLLARRQLQPEDDRAPADPLTEASPVLASLVGASVQGRVALGPRAGARVRRLGDESDLGHVASRGPRQAQLDGFDLHANVWVPPNDRARLEQLCRYLLRPPLAQARLRADGRVLTASSPRVRAGARRSSTTAAQRST